MQESEPFCLDVDGEPDLTPDIKKRNRMIGYVAAFLTVFTLGTTEIFASWYSTQMGGTPLEAGLAFGVFGLVYMFSPAIGGRLSDRKGRKKTLLLSTGGYIIVIILFLLPYVSPWQLIGIRALEGFVFGFVAPTIEGMVSELETESEVATLGNFSTSWSASMILPPMVIAYLSGAYGDTSGIFVVLGVEILALMIVAGFLQGYKRKPVTSSSNVGILPSPTPAQVEKVSKTSPLFIASYLSVMLWGVVSTIVLGLFPSYILLLSDLGYPFAAEDFGNLLLVWNLARTLTFIVIARLSGERMKQAIIAGAILSALSGFMLFLFIDIGVFTIAMILSGIAVGFNYLGALYLVVSATDIEKGGHAGLVESMGGVGLFLGPIAGGWLMQIGLTLPYLMWSLLGVVILVLIVFFLRRDGKQN
ncbi:MAG: MFS transporter [Candidatus Thorarchaeota archaeon]|nr:MAG: MFS transporter [Candidatus Thorarchaeota archaeon]